MNEKVGPYFVFMQTLRNPLDSISSKDRPAHLDLDVEHGMGVDLESECDLDIVCQTLFVALLDGRPFISESLIFGERK